MAKKPQEQGEIEGFERPKIAAIEGPAKKYESAIRDRLDAQETEEKAGDKLQKALHDNEAQLVDRDKDGNPGYVYDDGGERKIAILKRSEEKVQVKKYIAPKPKQPEASE